MPARTSQIQCDSEPEVRTATACVSIKDNRRNSSVSHFNPARSNCGGTIDKTVVSQRTALHSAAEGNQQPTSDPEGGAVDGKVSMVCTDGRGQARQRRIARANASMPDVARQLCTKLPATPAGVAVSAGEDEARRITSQPASTVFMSVVDEAAAYFSQALRLSDAVADRPRGPASIRRHESSYSPAQKRCRGWKNNQGKCHAPAKSGYAYCCYLHDPSFTYYPPEQFAKSDLRKLKYSDIMKKCGNVDIYHPDLAQLPRDGIQLDHIVEKQCFSVAFTRTKARLSDRQGIDTELAKLISVVCEHIANDNDNLAFTTTTTNQLKGIACKKFLDDCLTGHQTGEFKEYLLAAHTFDIVDRTPWRERSRLQEDQVKSICHAMGTAMELCWAKLKRRGGEATDIVTEELIAQLTQLSVDMQLE